MEATAATTPGGMGRRRFMRFLGWFAGFSTLSMIATPVIGFLIPSRSSQGAAGGRILAGTVQTIPPGQAKVVAVGSRPGIVINTEAGVKAYSAICTHLACIVAWDPGSGTIVCPCHDGRFSPASGAVLSGPPPAPLPALTTSVEGDEIYIVTG